jgi:hypothetical protein
MLKKEEIDQMLTSETWRLQDLIKEKEPKEKEPYFEVLSQENNPEFHEQLRDLELLLSLAKGELARRDGL